VVTLCHGALLLLQVHKRREADMFPAWLPCCFGRCGSAPVGRLSL